MENNKPEEEQPADVIDKQPGGGNGKEVNPDQSKKMEPPKDFKIAEIWIRDGQLQLDGVDDFWHDPFRAIGVLDRCKDIVKQYKPPKSKIIQPKGAMMDFVRQKFKGRKK